jgi:hypothetical protein
MNGENAPMDALRVENPPVGIVVSAWFTASNDRHAAEGTAPRAAR